MLAPQNFTYFYVFHFLSEMVPTSSSMSGILRSCTKKHENSCNRQPEEQLLKGASLLALPGFSPGVNNCRLLLVTRAV